MSTIDHRGGGLNHLAWCSRAQTALQGQQPYSACENGLTWPTMQEDNGDSIFLGGEQSGEMKLVGAS
jgi:hypothetical protein